jgi:hypothetical protein
VTRREPSTGTRTSSAPRSGCGSRLRTSRRSDYWFLHSHDGGSTWVEARVTPTSFDHKLAPFANGLFLGDYVGLAPDGGEFLALFTNTEASDPASEFASTLTP